MNRIERIVAATDTLRILEKGQYQNQGGEIISIKDQTEIAILESILYKPDEFDPIFERLKMLPAGRTQTQFEVCNETTLQAAFRLTTETDRILCLNFASAKKPGGGFLTGAQAQEESLARSSSLYPCIAQMREMYLSNKSCRSCLYTDYMIYTPSLPVFRDDDGILLDQYYTVSFITSPAVNAGIVRTQEPENIAKIESTMLVRLEKILAIAMDKGYRHLVLGAWGCGVFRNDPAEIADFFKQQLFENPWFQNRFEKVVFAIFDKSTGQSNLRPFEEVFGKNNAE